MCRGFQMSVTDLRFQPQMLQNKYSNKKDHIFYKVLFDLCVELTICKATKFILIVLEDQNHKELLSLQTDKAYLCWQFTCFDKIAGSFSLQGPNELGGQWGLIVLRPPNVQTKSDLNKYFSALNV